MPDTALLIIDMQTALLRDVYDVEACLHKVADLAEQARSAGVPIVYLRQRPMTCLLISPTSIRR
ncbi:isochorismatase family protein [Streptomyces sp. NPDC059371]|uniref:isochorismatase family protein n=1 Tax=Streptomyces sp. NPDC059371 TaxID=3346812 RepID=UPI00368B0CD9